MKKGKKKFVVTVYDMFKNDFRYEDVIAKDKKHALDQVEAYLNKDEHVDSIMEIVWEKSNMKNIWWMILAVIITIIISIYGLLNYTALPYLVVQVYVFIASCLGLLLSGVLIMLIIDLIYIDR